MSAFVVSDNHISAIVQGVYGTDYRGFNIWRYLGDKEPSAEQFSIRNKAQSEANELMRENIRSVNWRYRNSAHIEKSGELVGNVRLKFDAEPLEPLQVLKLIECLAYQACETDDWEKSLSFKMLNQYRATMVGKLAGYNEAKWAI